MAAEHPAILPLIEARRIDLSRIVTVGPHLDESNREELIERACSMSQHELEFYLAGLAPRPIPRDTARALAAPAPGLPVALAPAGETPGAGAGALAGTGAAAAPARATAPPARIEPLTSELARLSVTVDRETVRAYRRACDLLHLSPNRGGPAVARALRLLLEQIDPELKLAAGKPAKARASDPGARRIPMHVRRAVWKRDGGQCTFRDGEGNRCCARAGLQFDHIRPWAAGGRSDDADNVRLRCRVHNAAEARRWFGDEHVDRAIELARKRRREQREAPD